MSFIDRIAATLTPAASDEKRAEARRHAEELAAGEEWLAMVLTHHKKIERLISEAFASPDANGRRDCVRQLEMVLTGHATAEEAVLYPDIADFSGKTHAGIAYEEHAMTKIQLARLEKMDPMSEEWREKLAHIEGALQQHMYQEEGSWLPDLVQNLPPAEKARMSRRFAEEYERYCGTDTKMNSPQPGNFVPAS